MNLHTASQVSASFEENKDSFLCIHFSCGSKKRSPFPASPWGRRAPAQCCGWGRGLERASQPRADRRQVVRTWIWMSSGERSLREQGARPDFPSDPLSVCRWKKELRFTSSRLQPHARGGRPAASPTVAAWGRKSLSGSNREQTGEPR